MILFFGAKSFLICADSWFIRSRWPNWDRPWCGFCDCQVDLVRMRLFFLPNGVKRGPWEVWYIMFLKWLFRFNWNFKWNEYGILNTLVFIDWSIELNDVNSLLGLNVIVVAIADWAGFELFGGFWKACFKIRRAFYWLTHFSRYGPVIWRRKNFRKNRSDASRFIGADVWLNHAWPWRNKSTARSGCWIGDDLTIEWKTTWFMVLFSVMRVN